MRTKYPKLTKSAQGRPCTLNIAGVCNYDPTTVVGCHIDSEEKGISRKSPDWFLVFGCSACHTALDQHLISEQDRLFYANRGLLRTWKIWIEEGLIKL